MLSKIAASAPVRFKEWAKTVNNKIEYILLPWEVESYNYQLNKQRKINNSSYEEELSKFLKNLFANLMFFKGIQMFGTTPEDANQLYEEIKNIYKEDAKEKNFNI